MKKAVDVSKEINDIRKITANKKCFECGDNGTTYIVHEFGIFVCSGCAGIHREFNHRVKGLSMSNFSLSELELLRTQGNEACLRTWMARYNPQDFPQPGPKDTQRIKDFIRLKYKERRWYQEAASEMQAVSPPTWVEVKLPQALAAPSVAQPKAAQDLLALGDNKQQQPAGSEGGAEPKSTNQVNIQISFQPPKAEESKKVSPPPVQDLFYPPSKPTNLPIIYSAAPAYPPTSSDPRSPGVNQVLQQQFYIQSQTYLQIFGLSYPFDYQTWCQLAYPRPPM